MAHDSLITPQELQAILSDASAEDITILDVRWQLGRDDGKALYDQGHIPEASYVDLETQLAGPGSPEQGRHPLPDPQVFEAAVRSWGARRERLVVVYDDWNSFAAARAWWLLKAAGFRRVKILDGGWSAWIEAGLPQSKEAPRTRGSHEVITDFDAMPHVNIDEVANFDGLVLDARAAERFAGINEPVDPRAGHIPGAKNRPTSDNLTPDGRFQPTEILRNEIAAAAGQDLDGDTDVAVYCGSGVTATHLIFALHLTGKEASLYPGSWSQWSNDESRRVATGYDT